MKRKKRRAARKRGHVVQIVVKKDRTSPVGLNMWVVENGVKIARRGYPDTPEARTWVPLIAGVQVLDVGDIDSSDYGGIEVIHYGHIGCGAGH